MTDIKTLVERLRNVDDQYCHTAADAIEALQAECAEHKENAIRNARQAVAFRAERDALRAKLDELQRQEPVKFLVNGARFKLANCGPSSSGFVGFPKELVGRWVALVAADDNCHLKLAAPKALEPLTIQEVEQLIAQHNYELHGDRARYLVRMTEMHHGITKGTP